MADEDAFNARIARQAIGRTAGEILKEMEMTYNRLRRQVSAFERPAAQGRRRLGISSRRLRTRTNHYAEHAADVYMPPVDPNARRR